MSRTLVRHDRACREGMQSSVVRDRDNGSGRDNGNSGRTSDPDRVRDSDRGHSEQSDNAPQRGAGYAIVPDRPSGAAAPPAQWRYRAPSGSAMRSAVPVRSEAAGVPSAWSQPSPLYPRATTSMVRRWAAEGGPEGRGSENRVREPYTTPQRRVAISFPTPPRARHSRRRRSGPRTVPRSSAARRRQPRPRA